MGGSSASKIGENVGHLLGGWAKSLYVGIAAVVALMFLMNRKFADLAVFMLAAVLVGGFVMAPEDIASTVQSIPCAKNIRMLSSSAPETGCARS